MTFAFEAHRLKVLASAKLRGFEIHARAVVPCAVLATVHHLVFLLALGVDDTVFPGTEFSIHRLHPQHLPLRRLSS